MLSAEESDDERGNKEVKVTIVDSSPDQIYISPEHDDEPDKPIDEGDEAPESPAFMLDDKDKVKKAVPDAFNKEEMSF